MRSPCRPPSSAGSAPTRHRLGSSSSRCPGSRLSGEDLAGSSLQPLCLSLSLFRLIQSCIYLLFCLHGNLRVCPPAYLSICPSVCLPICLSARLPTYLPIYLPLFYGVIFVTCSRFPSTHLPIYPSTHLPIYPSTHLPIYPSTQLPIYPIDPRRESRSHGLSGPALSLPWSSL